MNAKQVGKFKIKFDDIYEEPDEVAKLLNGMVVVSASAEFLDMCIRYIAIAPYFDEVETGQDPPSYQLVRSGDEFFLLDALGNKL